MAQEQNDARSRRERGDGMTSPFERHVWHLQDTLLRLHRYYPPVPERIVVHPLDWDRLASRFVRGEDGGLIEVVASPHAPPGQALVVWTYESRLVARAMVVLIARLCGTGPLEVR